MSMSEERWQAWKPVNLLPALTPLVVGGQQVDNEVNEAIPQRDSPETLLQLRRQEEQRGYAQGIAQGQEEGHKLGYAAGFAQGKNEGSQQGLAECQRQQAQQSTRFSHLLNGLQDSLDQLDNLIPMRLMQIALMAVRVLLNEPTVSESLSAGLLRHISKLLKEDALLTGKLRICISVSEADAFREQLAPLMADREWELYPDPQLLPGGCRIDTEYGELDASLETRWQSLCQLIRQGGER